MLTDQPPTLVPHEATPTILDYDSLEPVLIPVRYQKRHYLLREASEGAFCVYQSAVFKSLKIQDGKPVAAEGISETDTLLVSQCLYEVQEQGVLRLTPHGDPDPKYLVPLATIRGWPRRIVKDLHQKLRSISGMDDRRTPEEVEKELAKLQGELQTLTSENGTGHGGSAKNELDATRVSSL